MKQTFGFIPTLEMRNKISYSDYDWKFMLKEELDKGHPILYSGYSGNGAGHAFILDGYQDTLFWHFNWGWSGYGNGYYNLNFEDPNTMDYYVNQSAMLGATPPTAAFCNEMEYNQDHWTFDDGSGYSLYQNDRDCSWLIEPADTCPVRLAFTSFHTEQDHDILYIYDGPDENATLIGSYSGTSLPPVIESTGNSLYLRFITNSSVQKPGWTASYSSILLNTGDPLYTALNLKAFPNPAKSQLTLSFDATAADDLSVLATDLAGRVVASFTQEVSAGRNQLLVPVESWAPGLYIITVEGRSVKGQVKVAVSGTD
jgi:hypothetical protein